MSEVLYPGINAFSPQQLNEVLKSDEHLIIVDTRSVAAFTEGFIPGSVFIGFEGHFVEWVVNLLPADKKIILITPAGKEEAYVALLTNVGIKNVLGYLDGGFEAWEQDGRKVDMIINVDTDELAMDIPFDENLVVVDVRKPVEYVEGHIKGALNIPLVEMIDPGTFAELEDRHNLYLHCASGYRSVIAASLLKQQGYNNLRNITGGWESIKHTKGITTEKDASALN